MPPISELRTQRAGNIEAVRTVAKLLDVPLDELAGVAPRPDPATDDNVHELLDRIVRRAQYVGLRELLAQLDGWIKTVRQNCVANEHGSAAQHDDGRLCGQDFDVADFREMVNGAADELRLPRPYRPAVDDA